MARDVVVAGGGIIGLAVGLRLARAGFGVSVFDRHGAGSEASSAAAGLLAAQCLTDPPGPGASGVRGAGSAGSPAPGAPVRPSAGAPGAPGVEEAFFRASLQARDLYAGFLEDVAARSRRPVSWNLRGNLCVATGAAHAAALAERVRRHRERGLPAESLAGAAVAARFPGVRAEAGALFPADGVVDNQALLPALREALIACGGSVHEEDPVVGILVESGRAVGLRTRSATHAAGAVVLAAGAWADELLPPGEPRSGARPARGQIVVLDAGAQGPDVPVIGEHMYVVPRAAGRVLLGSTVEDAGFDRSVTAGGVAAILDGVREFYPAVERWTWVTAWSGLRPRPADDWPVVGPGVETRGLWIAGGHYRNGILWAPLTAEWILGGIQGSPLPDDAAWFAPGRFADSRAAAEPGHASSR